MYHASVRAVVFDAYRTLHARATNTTPEGVLMAIQVDSLAYLAQPRSRRVRSYTIDAESLIAQMLWTSAERHAWYEGLPDDARVLAISAGMNGPSFGLLFNILIASETFDEVPEGAYPPPASIIVHSVDSSKVS